MSQRTVASTHSPNALSHHSVLSIHQYTVTTMSQHPVTTPCPNTESILWIQSQWRHTLRKKSTFLNAYLIPTLTKKSMFLNTHNSMSQHTVTTHCPIIHSGIHNLGKPQIYRQSILWIQSQWRHTLNSETSKKINISQCLFNSDTYKKNQCSLTLTTHCPIIHSGIQNLGKPQLYTRDHSPCSLSRWALVQYGINSVNPESMKTHIQFWDLEKNQHFLMHIQFWNKLTYWLGWFPKLLWI